MKICWGSTTTTNVNSYYRNASVFFPVTYTANPILFTGKVNPDNSATTTRITVCAGAVTTTSGTVWAADPNGGIANVNVPIRWLAIGY